MLSCKTIIICPQMSQVSDSDTYSKVSRDNSQVLVIVASVWREEGEGEMS